MTALAVQLSGTSDVHASLRAATEATHLRLHGLAQFTAIAAGRLDRMGYAALLGSLHSYHAAVARAAVQASPAPPSSSLRRLELLAADLASLGAEPAAVVQAWTASSRAALYGALYVAEGSALGGKVIARQLDYLLGDDPAGRTFFRGDGDTGPRWRAFLAVLERDCGDPAMLPDLISGAEASFALFERCLSA